MSTTPAYNKTTCFLDWVLQGNANDEPYLWAQVEMLKLDITVSRDPSGKTWAVRLDGAIAADEIATAAHAQLIAVAEVIREIAERCGCPMTDSTGDRQRMARALMQELHSRTKDQMQHDACERRCIPLREGGEHYE